MSNALRLYLSLNRRGLLRILPDKLHLSILYRLYFGRKICWENPKTFNEKLQWIKLFDRNPLYTTLVDKHRVKEWVSQTIGESYVVPLLGVWDSAEEINLDELPNDFVLKTTHDSGGVYIIRDKSEKQLEEAKADIRRRLDTDFYSALREWPYKDVPRKVIAESLLDLSTSGESDLPDYKVLCFNGRPSYIQVHHGRSTHHTQDFYTADWNYLGIEQGMPASGCPEAPPPFLQEMLRLSSVLSSGIPEVRVDWYFSGNQLFFGELTFFDGGGFIPFTPDEWDLRFGEQIDLSHSWGVQR